MSTVGQPAASRHSKRQKCFLICNAHLDPVWLWTWEEGLAEAISTYRVAADFCDQYRDFVFNHNESLLYEWVERNDPELFRRIQKHVRSGNGISQEELSFSRTSSRPRENRRFDTISSASSISSRNSERNRRQLITLIPLAILRD